MATSALPPLRLTGDLNADVPAVERWVDSMTVDQLAAVIGFAAFVEQAAKHRMAVSLRGEVLQ